jgi:hypothetical protein
MVFSIYLFTFKGKVGKTSHKCSFYCTTAKVLGLLVTQSIQGARLSFQSSELAPLVPSPASGAQCPAQPLPLSFRSGGDILACGRGGGAGGEPI